ncbi:MAG: hypothetical protein R3A47_09270 [Polyangiales bacterium]
MEQKKFSVIVIFVCLLGSALVVPRAYAHPLVDEAVKAYNNADFDRALKALNRAEAGDDLNTADLMQLFEMRAMVYSAMDQEESMRMDLQRLASMKPTHRLGRIAPPQVRDAFDEVRAAVQGAIAIDLNAQALPGELTITARVRRDVTKIGKHLFIFTKSGEAEWVKHEGNEAKVSAPDGAKVEYYAELMGPGGAVVTNVGGAEGARLAQIPAILEPEVIVKEKFKAKIPAGVWALWGVGAAGLIGGGVTGVLTMREDNRLKDGCGGSGVSLCTQSDVDKADRFALMTDVMLMSGGASAVAGTVWFLVSRKKQKREFESQQSTVGFSRHEQRARVTNVAPWIASQSGGLVLRGSY